MRLIGLSGYARSGKDTAAAALVEFGWTRIAFADKLREMAYDLNPTFFSGVTIWSVAPVIDKYGWDGYKETAYAEPVRNVLQRLGVVARKNLGENVWVDAALADLDPNGSYVITDVRFPNEAEAIVDKGGVNVRITRPGFGPINGHISETALDDYQFSAYITNDRTPDELAMRILGVSTCV